MANETPVLATGFYWLKDAIGNYAMAHHYEGQWMFHGHDDYAMPEDAARYTVVTRILSPGEPQRRIKADTVNFDKLHEYVGFADDLELDFGFNEKELLAKRRKIWSLNRENAAWKYRTMREGFILKIFKFAL